MRTFAFFSAMVVAFSLLSCQDANEEIKKDSTISEYKSVGMKIPTDVGARWIDTYQKNSAGRFGLLYSFGSTNLGTVKNSVSNFVGMAFHYAIDEYGDRHIIAIPVDETLRLWTPIENRLYFDTNTNSILDKETAESWAANYKTQNPDGIWFHFFGANVVDDILAIPGFDMMNVVPALNDLDFSTELLLVIGSTEGLLLGRTASETNVYDASYPCPRCEVQ